MAVTTEDARLGLAPAAEPRGLLRRGWEVFAQNRLALVAVGAVAFMAAFSFAEPLFYHTDQTHTNLSDYLCRPAPCTCSAAMTSATTSSAG